MNSLTEKIYLDNPYIRKINAKILEKKCIDDKYFLILNKTIFYPHLAGGQPKDEGTINDIKVLDVYLENEEIVHVVNKDIDTVDVVLSIDWDTRLDHMQQHTGQHLLSHVINTLYNGETIGFHLGEQLSTIDITVKDLNNEMVNKIETIANKIIFSNFEIKNYTVNNDTLEQLPLRKKPPINNQIRIVEIDGIDFSPCCGTHHRNTGEIGIIKIIKWEKYKGNTRIEFLCGNRALKDYSIKNEQLNKISTLLSSKDANVYEKVEKLYNNKNVLEKENKSLKEQLLNMRIKELLNNSISIGNNKIIIGIFDDIDFQDLAYLATNLRNNKNIICILGLNANDKSQFLLSRSDNVDIDMMDVFKKISKAKDIKGGGNSLRVQGGCDVDELNIIINSAYEIVKNKRG